MSWKIMHWHSLKIKVMLAVLVTFVGSVVLLGLIATRLLRADMQQLLGDQQTATVALVAANIAIHLQDRQDALAHIAKTTDATVLGQSALAQKYLEQRLFPRIPFNAGTFLTRLDGVVVAEIPLMNRVGRNYLGIDHIAKALKDGKASVGKPVISTRLQIPLFAMTVPIRDAQGKVVGALSGAIDLSQPNFLDSIHQGSYGKSGGYLIVDPQNRLFVAATAHYKKMVMQSLPAPGANAVLDQRLLGFDGAAVNVSSHGTEVLTSSARIPLAGWLVIAVLPTQEAFAPLRTLEQHILWVAIVLTLLAGSLMWGMLQRLLLPLQVASRALTDCADQGEAARPLLIAQPAQPDEVGVLIGNFNRVLEVAAQREKNLRESEERFRHFFDKNSSVQLLIDPSTFVIENANQAAAAYYGYPQDSLIGMSIADINLLPKHRLAEEMQLAVREERNYFLFQHRLASGEVRDVEVHATPMDHAGHTLMFAIIHDITERRQAQAQLEQVLSEQRTILNSDVVGFVKLKGRHVVWLNPAFASMLGYTVEEIMGQPTRMAYPNDDAYLAFATQAYPVLQRGDIFRAEVQYQRKDQTLQWFSVNGQALHTGSDESIWLVVNIQERVQNELALRESQDRLIRAQEGAHVGIWEWNMVTGQSYWSPECERLYGLEPGTLNSNDEWRMLVHPDDLALIELQWINKICRGKPFETEYRLRTGGGGDYRWFLTKGYAQYGTDGKPIFLSGINLDITDRKFTETRLAQLLADQEAILQSEAVCFSITTSQRCIHWVNQAAANMLGYERHELINQSARMLYPSDEAYLAFGHEAYAELSAGRVFHGQSQWCHKNGSLKWFDISGVSLPSDKNITIWACVDISSLKSTEANLRVAKEAAEAANIAKSRFLATMSHEIRTPMNGILGMSQLLLMPNVQDDDVRDYARTILSSGNTLMALLNDILDLSKIEAGKFQLDATVFEPECLLREIQALFSGTAQAKRLQMAFHWRGPTRQRYKADALRLRQMLSNLVSNAVKFTSQGQVRVEGTEMACDDESALLEFSVSDTGVGIAEDKMHLLFKPFSQTDSSTTREFGGSGLGLSIVSNLAKAMGGDVGAESSVGKGSRFWFCVRAKRLAEDVDARQAGNRPAMQSENWHLAQLHGRVLVAEDTFINRRVIESFLGQLGVSATLVQDGQQTVAIITQGSERPDAILMDVHMPIMDGYQATEQIRQWETDNQQPRLPVIALTAHACEADRQHCLAVGMDDFLSKPIELNALASVLAKWLPVVSEPATETAVATQSVDVPRLTALIKELTPMLEHNSFDAIRHFKSLKSLLANTCLAAEVVEMEAWLETLRFDLILQRLHRMLASQTTKELL